MELLKPAACVVVAAIWAGACGGSSSGIVTLGVPGRANANVSIASEGDIVALAWSTAADTGTDIYAAVSTDGGVTFGEPVRVNDVPGTATVNPETPPRVAVRSTAGGVDLAVSWMSTVDGTTLRLARSHDGGRTFGVSVAVSPPGAPGNRGWHAMSAIDEQGRVALLWLDHRDLAAPFAAPADPGADPHVHGTMDGAAMAQRSQLLFADAMEGAPIVEVPAARGVCYCCKTAVARGADGSLYAAWRQVYPGNVRDIAFAFARDGRTFGTPERVSEDRWELDGCPEDGPSIALAGGRVHVAWPTVVSALEGEPAKALFTSTAPADGGPFAARERVPTTGSPAHPQLAAAADGALALAWDEFADGVRRVVVAERAPGAPAFARRELGRAPEGRYPVVSAARDAWVLAWTDADGRQILVTRLRRQI